jgi:diketogulonate reductase-like aldo/keto reductase
MTQYYELGGLRVPPFLYGTAWKEDRTEQCVLAAIAAGFRGIDTANQRKHYFELGVGAALAKAYAAGTVKRADLFLQTKFTFLRGQDERLPYDPKAPVYEQVKQSFKSSLEHLGTDYLDSYVLHGPSTGSGLTQDDRDAWRAIEDLHATGKIRLLGVSNVNAAQLEELCGAARVKPSVAQIRTYASRGWERDIRAVCGQHGILFQCFSLLTANREVPSHPAFQKIQKRLGCTPPQLLFRFAFHLGWLPLSGTTDPTHMREDLACDCFELTPGEVRDLETLTG